MESSPGDDDRVFRDAMAVFPTGVVAVTSVADGLPLGLTIGSFFSVSLRPRLVGFCADSQSATWSKIEASGRFCANVLGSDQQAVSERLAVRGDFNKMVAIDCSRTATGLPVISGALAWFACDIVESHVAGTHKVVIGAVKDLDVCRHDTPLVFLRRTYYSVSADHMGRETWTRAGQHP